MRHITHQRNRDFIRQCRKSQSALIMRGINPTLEDIVNHALTQPAPSYYVDFYRATSRLKKIQHDGICAPKGSYASSRQWHDMSADLVELQEAFPTAKINDLILGLCSGKAGYPRFYLTRRRAMELVREAFSSKNNSTIQNTHYANHLF